MRNLILSIFILFCFHSNGQTIQDVNRIFTTYQSALDVLNQEIINYNQLDSTSDSSNLKNIIDKLSIFQQHKFSLDSGFVVYQFLSSRALLDKILVKKNLKKKNRDQLKSELLDWSLSNCNPKSDQYWHSTSTFFSGSSNRINQFNNQTGNPEVSAYNTAMIEKYLKQEFLIQIEQQKKIIDLILKDLPK